MRLTFVDPGHPRIKLHDNGRTSPLPSQLAMERTIVTARGLEAAGFHRYWLGEHHVPENFHSSPELVALRLLEATSSMRIGTAGVLLPYQSAHRVAESFRSLGNWFRDRVDLGVAKGPGAVEEVRPALVKEDGFNPEVFQEDLRRLHSLLGSTPDMPIAPQQTPGLDLWCHSGNPETVQVAAGLGLGIGVALFLSDDHSQERFDRLGSFVQKNYLDKFQPGPYGAAPRVCAVESIICIDDPALADAMARLPTRRPWMKGFIGGPEDSAAHAERIMEATRATEFGIFQSPFLDRLVVKSCSLLAQQFGVPRRSSVDAVLADNAATPGQALHA